MRQLLFILAAAVIIGIAVVSGEAGSVAIALVFGIAWRPQQ